MWGLGLGATTLGGGVEQVDLGTGELQQVWAKAHQSP